MRTSEFASIQLITAMKVQFLYNSQKQILWGILSSYIAAACIITCHLLQHTEYKQQQYTSHSVRINVPATGLLAWLIKILGRWSSEAYQLIVYIWITIAMRPRC